MANSYSSIRYEFYIKFKELNCRFDEVNFKLLFCVARLSLDDSFVAFNNEKLIYPQFYPNDILAVQSITLDNQLQMYIYNWHACILVKNSQHLASNHYKQKKRGIYRRFLSKTILKTKFADGFSKPSAKN